MFYILFLLIKIIITIIFRLQKRYKTAINFFLFLTIIS